MSRGRSPIPGPALRSCWTYVEGLPMHARVSRHPTSTMPPFVLVHGQVVSSRYMEPLAERLAQKAHVYAPDLPGFGRSAKPRSTLGVSQLADVLAAWMSAQGLEPAVVVGNSFGCQVSAALAVRHPARVRRLVLQAPTIDRHARSARPQIVRWLRAGRYERPSLTLIMLRDYLSAGARRSLETFQIVLRDAIEELLPRIEAPTLVVRGSRDPIVPASWAEEVTALLPHGRLVVIPGAGHTLNHSAPLELSRVILGFVRTMDQPPPPDPWRALPAAVEERS